MAPDWRPLSISPQNRKTPLLAKCTFASDSYSVHVTDLCSVWSETLEKQGIIARAHESRCSLDPDDGASQLQQFLEKIHEAFRGDKGTEVTVAWVSADEELVISSVSPLPKPLGPLRWSMHLSRQPESAIRSSVILPLMGVAFIQKQQIQELELFLQEKDNAIGKIVDKVEALGIDLSNVFPQAGASRFGKKKSQRERVLKQVRGLAPFDSEAWRAESGSALQSTPSFHEAARIAFDGSGSAKAQSIGQDVEFADAGEHGDASRARLAQRSRDIPEQTSQVESQPDGFQRQTTPPALKQSDMEEYLGEERHGRMNQNDIDVPEVKKEADDDETTEDEDEAEAEARKADTRTNAAFSAEPARTTPISRVSSPPSKLPVSEAASRPSPSPRKLGLVGKRNIPQQLAESSQPPAAPDRQSQEDDSENLDIATAQDSRNGRDPTPPSRPARRLGKIGGRRTQQDSLPGPSVQLDRGTDSQGNESVTNISDHSTLEGDHPPETTADVPKALPNVKITQDESQAPPEETAQEKADRKRIELKRGIEEKNNVAKKKKRRF